MKIIKNIEERHREDLEIIIRAKKVLESNGYKFEKEKTHFDKIVEVIEQKLKEEFGKEIKHNLNSHRYFLWGKKDPMYQPRLGTIRTTKVLQYEEAQEMTKLFTQKELQRYASEKEIQDMTAKYTTMAEILIECSIRGFLPKPPIRYLYCKRCGITTNFKRGTPALESMTCKKCKHVYAHRVTGNFYNEQT